jgi:hypothetical protein
MLLAHDMPKFLWTAAVSYASWLRNHLPSRATPGHTPYDLVHGRCPDLSQAHEFGPRVYVQVLDARKLEARVEEAIFVGVDDQSKGYRVYWPGKHRISVERNISFVPTTVTVAADVPVEGEKVTPTPVPTSNAQHVSPTTPSTLPKVQQPLPIPTAPRATHIHPPVGYYKALNQGESASIATIPEPDDDMELTQWALAAAEPEPTLQQALNGPDAIEWQEAVDYEISQLEKLGAWEVVDPPKHANIIPCHYVLVTKRGPDGEKLKLRA